MNVKRSTGDHAPQQLSAPDIGTLELFALLVLYAALWLLLTPYAGLSHDAQAYAFQALARLDPTVLGQDVFLKYDSQDRFTVFPVIYAALIQSFGLESTAFVLTLACHLMWYGTAFLICRQLFGTSLSLLSLALLITIPGSYGGQGVFHFAEPFLTARLPAEVISLAAIWAYLHGARPLAAVLVVIASLIHPLMAFPAFLLLALLWIDAARPWGLAMPQAACTIIVGAIVGSFLLGGSTAIMSDEWIRTAYARSDFLFLDRWKPADWNHTLTGLLTLAIASLALAVGPSRTIARAALWVALAGLLLAAFASEIWNLKILMQGQPWRWLWLGRFVAIAVLPATLYAAWSSGAAGRATAFLLTAAWLAVEPVSSRAVVHAMMGTLLAASALIIWVTKARMPLSTQVLVRRGAAAALVLVLVAAAVTASLRAQMLRSDQDIPQITQRLLMVISLITPAVAIVAAAWAGMHFIRRPVVTASVAVAGCLLMVAAAPFAIGRWADRTYTGPNYENFADWRAVIPTQAEVFWWDGLREVWFLLGRRSYLTLSQGGGVVFSPEVSAELHRRAANTAAFIDPGYWFHEPESQAARPYPLTKEILAQTCRDPALGFVVSRDDLGTGAPRKDWPVQGKQVYLYDCNDFRDGGAS